MQIVGRSGGMSGTPHRSRSCQSIFPRSFIEVQGCVHLLAMGVRREHGTGSWRGEAMSRRGWRENHCTGLVKCELCRRFVRAHALPRRPRSNIEGKARFGTRKPLIHRNTAKGRGVHNVERSCSEPDPVPVHGRGKSAAAIRGITAMQRSRKAIGV